jgi:hypothetical protein
VSIPPWLRGEPGSRWDSTTTTFFLFAGLSVVALGYFQRQVPETKNRSLQDIERDLDLPERHDDLRQRPVSRAHQ